jgi:hypothetical protein
METMRKALGQAIEERGRRIATNMQCPVCNREMKFTEEFGKYYYVCAAFPKQCDVTLGAHPDGTPMGKPADNYTRCCRAKAHVAFDPIWQDYAGPLGKEKVRQMAYRWLADRLGMSEDSSHIGNLNAPTCQDIVRHCKGVTGQAVVDWCNSKDNDLSPEQKFLKAKGIIKGKAPSAPPPASPVTVPAVLPAAQPEKTDLPPSSRFGVVSHATEDDIRALGKYIRESRKEKAREASLTTPVKAAVTSFNLKDLFEKALKEKEGKKQEPQ